MTVGSYNSLRNGDEVEWPFPNHLLRWDPGQLLHEPVPKSDPEVTVVDDDPFLYSINDLAVEQGFSITDFGLCLVQNRDVPDALDSTDDVPFPVPEW